MRAREPDHAGLVDRDGVKLAYEVFGSGTPTVLLMPTWSIIHSRFWKLQVPYLARHFRVVTFDGRGCGRSDRPAGSEAYADSEFAADTVGVLDATQTDSAVLVGLSLGCPWALQVAAEHPDRVLGVMAIGSAALKTASSEADHRRPVWDELDERPEGWSKFNRRYWLEGGYASFLGFFFEEMFPEPHSTKQIEDTIGWGHQIDPATLVDTVEGGSAYRNPRFDDVIRNVRCPVLVVHGDDDRIRPHREGVALADLTGASMVTVGGGGHGQPGRDPVLINRLVRDFVGRVAPAPTRTAWTRAVRRPKRALYLSSPIGLGHARRDVAIAHHLRALHPNLQIDWLAQHPVTKFLEGAEEMVHPASAWLASESAHVEAEAGEHDLHAFQAIRRMDEILVNNFMVFNDVVEETPYDLVVGDEAWDVDYFLHENPELKRFAFAWLTDFVGWLPMAGGGATEAALIADYNAEMLEQRARYRRIRDRSIFVGDPDDVVPDTFGPGLPAIRSWTEENFDFAGYVTGFDPMGLDDRDALRDELGYRPDERLCVVTVGGSGVGGSLLRRVLEAAPIARRLVPELRFLVVTGPRIDPASLPQHDGVAVRGYVPDLHRHLAASDVAVVQGGLTTCMELTASRRPFLYFPLANHFEQQRHVAHRLDRYGAGRRMDYAHAGPEDIAVAIAHELARTVDYLPVPSDGAATAARMLAELI